MTRDKNRELDFHASFGFAIGGTRVFGRLYGVSGKALKEVRNHEGLSCRVHLTFSFAYEYRRRRMKIFVENFKLRLYSVFILFYHIKFENGAAVQHYPIAYPYSPY